MRILASPYTHALSHLSRPLLVARELRKRGHEVVFAGDTLKSKFLKVVQDEGFKTVAVYEPSPEVLLGNLHQEKIRFMNEMEIERMIEADIALYKKVKPDMVLTDCRYTAPIAAYAAGVKHAAITTVWNTAYRAFSCKPLFGRLPDWLAGKNIGLGKMLDLLNIKLEMLVYDNVMSIFKKLSRKYGLKHAVTATNCMAGKDITLLAEIPEFFPAKNLPPNYHYIGPLAWKGDLPPPSWWPPAKTDNNRPIIYLTIGTTGIYDFFYKVYKLLEAAPVTSIITTAGKTMNLAAIEGKLYVEPFIDLDLVMQACDIVVCHGGNITIYEALQHGKPIIGIPMTFSQKFNMRRVETLGLGKMLSWKKFHADPALLIKLIDLVTKEKSFSRNAAAFKNTLAAYHAAKTAADILEAINK